MPPPARAVPEEVVEEILLRLPPHKPACLIRASVVSKRWLALVSGARFTGRYREFHGAPPVLGFLQSWPWDAAPMKLAVWDPVTGRRRELQEPACMVVEHEDGQLGAAVLCAVSGCDHRACHDGPFRVVFFSLHFAGGANYGNFVARACVWTGEFSKPLSHVHGGEWSEPCSGIPIDTVGFIEPKPPVLVKDAVHFMLAYEHEYCGYNRYHGVVRVQILKYDLSSNCLSLIDAPLGAARHNGNPIIMALEDGTLGFARVKKLHLHIWRSRQMGSDGVAEWAGHRVINLNNIPPIKDPEKHVFLIGSVEGNDIIFVHTESSVYRINLKTLRRKKIWEGEYFNALIPYRSFYNPGGISLHLLSFVT
ncbi:unnamed protein product [Alopecurus aequalis]